MGRIIMPRKHKQNGYEQSAREFETLGCMLSSAFIVPIFTFSKILASKDSIKDSYRLNKSKFIIDAVGLLILIGLLGYWGTCHFFDNQLVICWEIDAVVIALLLVCLLIGMKRRGEL
jgi:hypothetical protein